VTAHRAIALGLTLIRVLAAPAGAESAKDMVLADCYSGADLCAALYEIRIGQRPVDEPLGDQLLTSS
jgi:hypothetical protein